VRRHIWLPEQIDKKMIVEGSVFTGETLRRTRGSCEVVWDSQLAKKSEKRKAAIIGPPQNSWELEIIAG
jgi:hypothetical protein